MSNSTDNVTAIGARAPKSAGEQSAAIKAATDQVRKLQGRVYDAMNLCRMALVAAGSEQSDDYEPEGPLRIAARELDAIWREMDIAATALEVDHV